MHRSVHNTIQYVQQSLQYLSPPPSWRRIPVSVDCHVKIASFTSPANPSIVVWPVVRLVGRCSCRDVNRHCKQMLWLEQWLCSLTTHTHASPTTRESSHVCKGRQPSLRQYLSPLRWEMTPFCFTVLCSIFAVYNFAVVWVSVCLSVCLAYDNFWNPWLRKFVYAALIQFSNENLEFISRSSV